MFQQDEQNSCSGIISECEFHVELGLSRSDTPTTRLGRGTRFHLVRLRSCGNGQGRPLNSPERGLSKKESFIETARCSRAAHPFPRQSNAPVPVAGPVTRPADRTRSAIDHREHHRQSEPDSPCAPSGYGPRNAKSERKQPEPGVGLEHRGSTKYHGSTAEPGVPRSPVVLPRGASAAHALGALRRLQEILVP